MKKFLALILALVLAFSLGTVAFAADASETDNVVDSRLTGETNKETTTVTVNTTAGAVGKIYYVEVAWETLAFEYNSADVTWDPDTHTYTNANSAWANGGKIENAITVTNHSNDEVTVSTAFATANMGVTAAITVNAGDATLESADIVAYDEPGDAASVSYDVTVSGTPNDGFTSGDSVGTITVTISHG